MNNRQIKEEKLEYILKSAGKAAIAFSGGVDSAFLLYKAASIPDFDVIAITARSAAVPEREIREAAGFCVKYGIKQIICDTEEMRLEEYRYNSERRCYFCKKEIFETLGKAAAESGFPVICDGSNRDDEGDYRPGMEALDEMGIRSPLREAGFTKEDIRICSKEAGLPTWNKASFACLATRIPYGEEITPDKLKMAQKAEEYLLETGLTQFRVRVHGKLARIEVLPEDIERIMTPEAREEIYRKFKSFGFVYTALDLKGYRQGSMNEMMTDRLND